MVKTAQDQNYESVPIVRADFTTAFSLSAETAAAVASAVLSRGVYIITPATDIVFSIDETPVASKDSGSLFLPAGSAYHTSVFDGERVSVLAYAEAGKVFIAKVL